MELTKVVDELLSKEQIRMAFLTFCRGLDQRDSAMAASVFLPDAVDHHPPLGSWPASEMEERLIAAFDSMFLDSQYFAGFPQVEVRGETAKSETYVWCAKRTYDEDDHGYRFQRLSGMVYFDDWRRSAGTWLISRRQFVPVWEVFHSIGAEPDGIARNYRAVSRDGTEEADDSLNYRAVAASFWTRDE
ncbi:nuclear transport factor 2 family protein [Nocardioides sp. AE5]|uniref:nuclear transport factor 2 family protein n=1 Tax=Nocardioides sp. AE5 TaxID=2962573 RepID=UPI00288284F8|nr:nuclear transport factor 2 family protein [Nocardioides sp. AE5]MDT0200466.1 nuclear transport factor 2 family protein [Nocardioides sp. AE5]